MMLRYKSRITKHIYETAKDFYEVGVISAERLREYEEACVLPETVALQTGDAARGFSSPAPAYAAGQRKG